MTSTSEHHFNVERYSIRSRNSADRTAIAEQLRALGKSDVTVHDLPRAARAQCGPADGIAIAGSVFLAGELRSDLLRHFDFLIS